MPQMNRILNHLKSKFFSKKRKFTRNWKPKLITLGLAIIVWFVVEYRTSEANSEWDEEDIRIVVPDAN